MLKSLSELRLINRLTAQVLVHCRFCILHIPLPVYQEASLGRCRNGSNIYMCVLTGLNLVHLFHLAPINLAKVLMSLMRRSNQSSGYASQNNGFPSSSGYPGKPSMTGANSSEGNMLWGGAVSAASNTRPPESSGRNQQQSPERWPPARPKGPDLKASSRKPLQSASAGHGVHCTW